MLQGFCLDWPGPASLASMSSQLRGLLVLEDVPNLQLRSEAQPGVLGLGHRSSSYSLESLKK